MEQQLKNDLLLRAAKRVPVERVPVWMMRQAGRSDPLYRQIRQELNLPLERLFRTCPTPMSDTDVEWAVKISLLPKRIGVDAIIVYKDILTPLAPMGAHFRFSPGPILSEPIRTQSQVDALCPLDDPYVQLEYTGQIICSLRKTLNGELPLIGFAGAPLTLAFFLIAGESPMKRGAGISEKATPVFEMMEDASELLHELLDKLTEMTINYLNYQISQGVQIVQLFESIADVLSQQMYEDFALPYHQRIFAELNSDAPGILFAKECSYVNLMRQSGADVLSIGKCVDLEKAKTEIGDSVAFQGNVDNDILRDGTFSDITEAVQTCIKQGGKTGHILNLSHGLHRDTPFENVKHFVNIAKTYQDS
ncbi:MAG: uroporphyrinogen decarboxylase family protein [Candidatus Poribacteria bacterium]|nr:uroporphyrinogen decarboxylase family protein [Candidatus Poribacteria bacterium]